MKETQVVIVGAGINGAGLFRDLALNNVRVTLIEKGDFSSQTSQSSSKMLHGGIRYLENFDFALVQEALEEKNLWLKLAPHLCFEREFYFPLYNFSKYPPFMLNIGLFLYDFLSHFKNRPHAMLSKEAILNKIPSLKSDGLKASGMYYDGIVDDAKLTLECIYDGLLESETEALSYHEVTSVESHSDHHIVTYENVFSKERFQIKAQYVVYTTGPFTDKLLPHLGLAAWKEKMLTSKGIHLWLKKDAIQIEGSVVLTTGEGRVIFVIPQRDAILVGTTETKVDAEIFNIKASKEEITYLLKILNEYFPKAIVKEDQIISTFAGVRPLVKEEGTSESRGKTSRFHQIYRPTHHSYVLLGGKYTTFRKMTQEVAQELVPRFGLSYNPNLTLNPLRQHSLYPTFGQRPKITPELIKAIIRQEKVTTLEDLIKRRLSMIEPLEKLEEIEGIKIEEIKKMLP